MKPLLMPIPHNRDTRPFRVITVDHITDLPDTEDGYNTVQVVVDHDVSKAVVLSTCNKDITMVEAAKLLWWDIFSYFGLPDRVVLDQGSQFSAQVFQELHRALGVKMSMSTAYHLQTDGQMEQVNQEIDLDLQIYCANNPTKWAEFLKAEHSYS